MATTTPRKSFIDRMSEISDIAHSVFEDVNVTNESVLLVASQVVIEFEVICNEHFRDNIRNTMEERIELAKAAAKAHFADDTDVTDSRFERGALLAMDAIKGANRVFFEVQVRVGDHQEVETVKTIVDRINRRLVSERRSFAKKRQEQDKRRRNAQETKRAKARSSKVQTREQIEARRSGSPVASTSQPAPKRKSEPAKKRAATKPKGELVS